ncbi:hypothetical protein CAPTEDRAFT_213776 [Capitella teleta]|uniref:RNA-directed DNA polymerase from mobile element jockey n=1 Tax=Capitella teleta TaxID=283909 RepID=R7U8C6_CAPTE|nr:hypothetical protein CAPTEDRAFT_213776 [Capitella teleta]|eukprot:ELU02239.1 hypothetical protein CAPTEDRAFT_213776 [Capitella teleta]
MAQCQDEYTVPAGSIAGLVDPHSQLQQLQLQHRIGIHATSAGGMNHSQQILASPTLTVTPKHSVTQMTRCCIALAGKDPALICPAIEEELRITAKWADNWGFNASKTVATYTSRTTATPPPITFAGVTLEYNHEHSHLGFILDSALSLHAHVNALTRKGATEVFLLRRLSYKVKNRDLLLKIYKMYVRPHLEYASPAWAALTVTQTGLLESLQRRAMRIILALPRIHHITDADYAALNITSSRHRLNFALACFMFKLNSNRLPRKLSKYKPIPHTNPYNTRNCVLRAPYVPYPCLRLLDRSPFLFGLKILNFISHTFLSLPDISSFKSSLRESSYYMPLAQIYY